MRKGKYYWLLLALAPCLFVVWYFVSKNEHKPLRYLAYFGPKHASNIKDTTYHTIPPFYFINQFNQKVTEQTIKGKIYVTDFFFTTCKSICPVMSNSLEKVYQQFKSRDDFLILSHTVDPETDSVKQLMEYARLHNVTDNKWLFLTGDKKHLYETARLGYLLNAEKGDGGADDFIHTQNFALVDKERRIRGFYDGTDSVEITRLIKEIKLLFEEYAYTEKHK
jgi:protein SCO1/2